ERAMVGRAIGWSVVVGLLGCGGTGPMAPTGSTGLPSDTASGAPEDTSTAGATVTVIPYIQGTAPASAMRWRAPDWFATFTEDGWVERSVGAPSPVVLDTGASGRFAVVTACRTLANPDIRVFLGSASDGETLTLPGCTDLEPPGVSVSRLLVDDSLYDDPPAKGSCGVVAYGNTFWFATCNPTAVVEFSTPAGPGGVYAERYTSANTVDRVVVDGPFSIPEGGAPDRPLDFDGPLAAPPIFVQPTPAGQPLTMRLVTDFGRLGVRPSDGDVGVATIPATLAPAGARYLATGQRIADGQPIVATERVVLDAPPATLELGQLYDPTAPTLTVVTGPDGAATLTLTAAADWSLAKATTFTAFARWDVTVTAGAVDGDTWVVPAGADIAGLASFIAAEAGVSEADVMLPDTGAFTVATVHARAGTPTPFDVWRADYSLDHLDEGTRLVEQGTLVQLP
ncbi:MAG: hypothetical protein AAF602_28870, partial [Myxococcota bacterium]